MLGKGIAIVLAIVIAVLVLLDVFAPDPLEDLEDDEPPPDARAWRDPWEDCA